MSSSIPDAAAPEAAAWLFPGVRLAWNIAALAYRRMQRQQSGVKGSGKPEEALSRVANLLSAFSVPADRLPGVACLLSDHPFLKRSCSYGLQLGPWCQANFCPPIPVWAMGAASAGWTFHARFLGVGPALSLM